jgi:hypothetical protein
MTWDEQTEEAIRLINHALESYQDDLVVLVRRLTLEPPAEYANWVRLLYWYGECSHRITTLEATLRTLVRYRDPQPKDRTIL